MLRRVAACGRCCHVVVILVIEDAESIPHDKVSESCLSRSWSRTMFAHCSPFRILGAPREVSIGISSEGTPMAPLTSPLPAKAPSESAARYCTQKSSPQVAGSPRKRILDRILGHHSAQRG